MEDLFMSKYYSINKFSKILGVSAQTLRNWDKKGKLHPHHTSSNGYRYYSHEQLNQVMNVKPNLDRKELMKRISQNKVDKVVVFYKDRLLRFGFELVEYIASLYDCNIEIIDHIMLWLDHYELLPLIHRPQLRSLLMPLALPYL